MAFARPTGKHRAPNRLTRRTATFAGAAALATTGVVGTLAAPAMAAEAAAPAVDSTGLALQDLALADVAYRAARAAGVGVEIDFGG